MTQKYRYSSFIIESIKTTPTVHLSALPENVESSQLKIPHYFYLLFLCQREHINDAGGFLGGFM